ncbi:hypothetical protein F2Q69_00020890 [Brassica cretica]|uniref:Uncharacterized protein n=1 Tax=Brassica cretica TaxID=69181 RepID=A0A8S9Q6T2_BRACR|nr:hypothetical protein F2Q69_00020890 [Brassica cretica]
MNNSTVRLSRQAMIDSGGTGGLMVKVSFVYALPSSPHLSADYEIKLLKEGVEHIDLKGVEFGETEV